MNRSGTLLVALEHSIPGPEQPVIIRALVVQTHDALTALSRFISDFLRRNRNHMRELCAGPAWGTVIHVGDSLSDVDVLETLRGRPVGITAPPRADPGST